MVSSVADRHARIERPWAGNPGGDDRNLGDHSVVDPDIPWVASTL